jgi:hypothetical protein
VILVEKVEVWPESFQQGVEQRRLAVAVDPAQGLVDHLPRHGAAQGLQAVVVVEQQGRQLGLEGVELQGEILAHGDQETGGGGTVANGRGQLADEGPEPGVVALVVKKLLELVQDQHQRVAAEQGAATQEVGQGSLQGQRVVLGELTLVLEGCRHLGLEGGAWITHPVVAVDDVQGLMGRWGRALEGRLQGCL